MMLVPYESPKIIVVGSVRDVIQANTFGAGVDNSTYVTIGPLPNIPNLNVLGSTLSVPLS
jgi:hypothetical protein